LTNVSIKTCISLGTELHSPDPEKLRQH